MDEQAHTDRLAIKNEENKPDLAANYRPIGIKAIIAACLVFKTEDQIPAPQRYEHNNKKFTRQALPLPEFRNPK